MGALAMIKRMTAKWHSIIGIAVISILGVAIFAHAAGQRGAASLQDQLVGTWMLVSMENDKKVQILGERPVGMIVFDAGGRFTSQVMRSDLPKFASADRTKATPEESQAVIRGYMGLFGTYSVEAPNTLRLHIISSSFPNWDGADQTRSVALNGDELELTNRTNSFGETSVHAFWKRVSVAR